ncbi:Gag-pol polyprotein [Camponotus japonicus]
MATFGSVVEKQNNLYGLIARSFDNVKKLGSDKINRHYLDTRIKSLDSNWERFNENHEKLVGALTEEISKHVYFTDDLYSTCEETYCQSRANIMILRDTLTTKSDDSSGSKPTSNIRRKSACQSFPESITSGRLSEIYSNQWWSSIRIFQQSKSCTISSRK